MRFGWQIAAIVIGSLVGCSSSDTHSSPRAAIVEHDASADAAPERTLVVQVTGDMLVHTRVNGVASSHSQLGLVDGYVHLMQRLSPSLALGDLNLINMETPMAVERNPPGGAYSTLNAPPELAQAMARVGFHAAFLANNHAYDQTARGVLETKDALVRAGLVTAGAGASASQAHASLDVAREGKSIAIFSFTEMVNAIDHHRRLPVDAPQAAVWNEREDLERVRLARATHDLVIVGFHWGEEFKDAPSPFQRDIAQKLCDAGADLIAGTHPHVLQPVQTLRRTDGGHCVIAYSLGNFLSNQGLKYRLGYIDPDPSKVQGMAATRDGALLRLTYAVTDRGVELSTLEAVPLWTENNWETRYDNAAFVHDVYVTPIAQAMGALSPGHRTRALYDERLIAISRALGDLPLTTY